MRTVDGVLLANGKRFGVKFMITQRSPMGGWFKNPDLRTISLATLGAIVTVEMAGKPVSIVLVRDDARHGTIEFFENVEG